MTDFELAYLFNEHVETTVAMLFGYFSITSAFLIATHITGHSLARFMACVVVALYTVASTAIIIITHRYVDMLVGIRDAMINNEMTWHPGVKETSFLLPVTFYLIVFALVAIFIASLWFFRVARRSGAVGALSVKIKNN